MNTCMAIDIGGTKMLIAEVSDQGQILNVKRYPTGRKTQSELLDLMIQGLKDYERTVGFVTNRPAKLGIGAMGRIDGVNGVWKFIDSGLPKENLPIRQIMKETFGYDCSIDNDVKAATLAEMTFGAGRGQKNFTYINVGTGLATGFVVDGHLLRGYENEAGEVGYTNFTSNNGPNTEDRTTGIGLEKHLHWILEDDPQNAPALGLSAEEYAVFASRMRKTKLAEEFYALQRSAFGTQGLDSNAVDGANGNADNAAPADNSIPSNSGTIKDNRGAGEATVTKDADKRIGGERIIALAQEGDELALFLTNQIIQGTALLVRNLIWTVSPERVVLSGGLMASDWLYEKVLEEIDNYYKTRLPGGIVRSQLNPAYTGLLGAAAVGFQGGAV